MIWKIFVRDNYIKKIYLLITSSSLTAFKFGKIIGNMVPSLFCRSIIERSIYNYNFFGHSCFTENTPHFTAGVPYCPLLLYSILLYYVSHPFGILYFSCCWYLICIVAYTYMYLYNINCLNFQPEPQTFDNHWIHYTIILLPNTDTLFSP